MRQDISPAQYRDRCALGATIVQNLAMVKAGLRDSTLGSSSPQGLVAQPGH